MRAEHRECGAFALRAAVFALSAWSSAAGLALLPLGSRWHWVWRWWTGSTAGQTCCKLITGRLNLQHVTYQALCYPLSTMPPRLQSRLFKLKLEHCVMDGDGEQLDSAAFARGCQLGHRSAGHGACCMLVKAQ